MGVKKHTIEEIRAQIYSNRLDNEESPDDLDLYELEAAIAIAETDNQTFKKIQKKIRSILATM
jgi:hypothetical protein